MLTIISEAGRNKEGRDMWLCRCDCGKEKVILGKSMRSGFTTSCGCYGASRGAANQYKHGCARRGKPERLYNVWIDIKKRCDNPNFVHYADYGGRGIKVCEEWHDNYSAFREWAMANGYDPEAKPKMCTIDRINVNGDYTPDNCRWVSMAVQGQNKRNNNRLEYQGEMLCITEIARRAHVCLRSLWTKVFVKHMPLQEAIDSLPPYEMPQLMTA